MKNLSCLFVLIFLLFSCGTGSRQTQDQKQEGAKWDAVMANHDVVMPMMGTTNGIRRKLKAFVKNQSNEGSAMITQASKLIVELDQADDSMMDWMQGYKKLGELQGTMSHEEIMQYLANEDQKIAKVKELFDTSIASGEALLKQLGTD